MVTCPNCGHSVAEGQRFCGNCGTDMQTTLASSRGSTVGEEQTSPYAYPQSTSYGYGYQPSLESPAGNSRLIVIGVVLILAVCCACACGIIFGIEIPDVVNFLRGSATPTPTKGSFLPFLYRMVV